MDSYDAFDYDYDGQAQAYAEETQSKACCCGLPEGTNDDCERCGLDRSIGKLDDRGWSGLIAFLDEHWPEDIFPTLTDDPERDTGPRIVSLVRWVDTLKQKNASEKSTRIKYQNIVYQMCSWLDSCYGRRPGRGTGTTVDSVVGDAKKLVEGLKGDVKSEAAAADALREEIADLRGLFDIPESLKSMVIAVLVAGQEFELADAIRNAPIRAPLPDENEAHGITEPGKPGPPSSDFAQLRCDQCGKPENANLGTSELTFVDGCACPEDTTPRPGWLAKGVRVKAWCGNGWALEIADYPGDPQFWVWWDRDANGGGRLHDVRSATVIPNPSNDPELAARLKGE